MTSSASGSGSQWLLTLLALAGASVLASSTAHAQPICVPQAIGVPGQPGPPAWWGGGSGPLEDPRWQGAMSYGHDNDDAQFRALQYTDGSQKYLVLSWDVKYDTGPETAGNDHLYVGFWDATNSRGNVIKLTRSLTTSSPDGTYAGGAFAAEVRYRDSTNPTAWDPITVVPPAPAWLQSDALLGATCIAGPPAQCTRWNVRMRVPVGAASPVSNPAAGLPIGNDFRMWYELRVEMASSVTRHKWPATAANVTDIPFSYPEPSTWSEVSTAASPCSTGVRLDYSHITTDNAGSSQISTTAANVFHARPVNGTAAAINGNQIRARFRIANWGSVIFSSPEWIDITPTSPSCASATGSAAAVASGASFDLSCSWTLTADQQCAYRPDVHNTCSPMPTQRNAHQCILVELSSTTGVVFSRQSAWNNMQFVTASKVQQPATVSIRGLPPLTGTHRDVYLGVATQNMPLAPPKNQDVRDAPKLITPVGTKEGARLQKLVQSGALTLAELSARMPTYLVRVYYDSGERLTLGGTPLPVLAAMPAFGYHVMHDGDIEGWKHDLVAAGAVELVPGFYKLAVPNDGSAEVVTSIETVDPSAPSPVEPPPTEPPPPPRPIWPWILLALLVLLLAIWMARRNAP